MQMKKHVLLKNIALDDVDEKTCIIKTLHLMMQMKNMYLKTSHLMMQMKKHVLKKHLT